MGYCRVLHGTAVYYRALGGTGVNCGVLVDTEGIGGVTGGYWWYSGVLQGTGENFLVLGLRDTEGYLAVIGGTVG